MQTGDTPSLRDVIRRQIDPGALADDPNVGRVVAHLCARHGHNTAAVLMYGSYLRGKRDTVLDFYVLLHSPAATLARWQAVLGRWLPPNVYNVHLPEPDEIRAKCAVLGLRQFTNANFRRLDCYFWARFTQPCVCVYAADPTVRDHLVGALTSACETFIDNVAGLMPQRFDAATFWRTGFSATYGTELRAEGREGIDGVYRAYADAFDARLRAYAGPSQSVVGVARGDLFTRGVGGGRRGRSIWFARRIAGKCLSVLRVAKAATTFEDGLAYILWKIERHSGIYLEPTARQLRYPLIFAWPLLWRLYRLGAFR